MLTRRMACVGFASAGFGWCSTAAVAVLRTVRVRLFVGRLAAVCGFRRVGNGGRFMVHGGTAGVMRVFGPVLRVW